MVSKRPLEEELRDGEKKILMTMLRAGTENVRFKKLKETKLSDRSITENLELLKDKNLVNRRELGTRRIDVRYELTDQGKLLGKRLVEKDEIITREALSEEGNELGWMFREFVHRDLNPKKMVKLIAEMWGTINILPLYSDYIRPLFKPTEEEANYAKFLQNIYFGSVDFKIFGNKIKPLLKRQRFKTEFVTQVWFIAKDFQAVGFDYKKAFYNERELMKNQSLNDSFIDKLMKKYKETLEEDCKAVGFELSLDRENFLQLRTWLILKAWALGSIRYHEQYKNILAIGCENLTN